MSKPLSPAAQKVLTAANGASSYGPDDCLNDAREIAAAALRAAGEQLDAAPGRSHQVPGIIAAERQLRRWAAELEGLDA